MLPDRRRSLMLLVGSAAVGLIFALVVRAVLYDRGRASDRYGGSSPPGKRSPQPGAIDRWRSSSNKPSPLARAVSNKPPTSEVSEADVVPAATAMAALGRPQTDADRAFEREAGGEMQNLLRDPPEPSMDPGPPIPG